MANALSDFIRNATPDEKARVYGKVIDKASEMQRQRYDTTFRPTRRCACKDLMCRFRQDKDGTPRPDLPCPHVTSESPGKWLYARA